MADIPMKPHSEACPPEPHVHGSKCDTSCPTCYTQIRSRFIFEPDLPDETTAREIALEQAVAAWQASYDPFSHPSPASPERITSSILERAEAFLKFLCPEPNLNYSTSGENS